MWHLEDCFSWHWFKFLNKVLLDAYYKADVVLLKKNFLKRSEFYSIGIKNLSTIPYCLSTHTDSYWLTIIATIHWVLIKCLVVMFTFTLSHSVLSKFYARVFILPGRYSYGEKFQGTWQKVTCVRVGEPGFEPWSDLKSHAVFRQNT